MVLRRALRSLGGAAARSCGAVAAAADLVAPFAQRSAAAASTSSASPICVGAFSQRQASLPRAATAAAAAAGTGTGAPWRYEQQRLPQPPGVDMNWPLLRRRYSTDAGAMGGKSILTPALVARLDGVAVRHEELCAAISRTPPPPVDEMMRINKAGGYTRPHGPAPC